MKYLLDTDHVSTLQKPTSADYRKLAARMNAHPAADFAAAVVSFHEQVLGAHALINANRRLADFLRGYELLLDIIAFYTGRRVVPYDQSAVAVFNGLMSVKPRMATLDRRIAATALTHNLILLTRNTSDFVGIPNLVVEDWTA